MGRIACLPWPEKENCYLFVSGSRKKTKDGDPPLTTPRISFVYEKDGVAAEWDGEYGPLQMWYEGHRDEAGAKEHYIWPFTNTPGLSWSQVAVNQNELPQRFNEGDYDGIFAVLEGWVVDHRPRWEATEGEDAS